jgi:hypothetical protein
MSMSKEEIESRLKDSVGIQVSSEWLDDCISFLQQEHPQKSITADRCMLQVLHADIRDIVNPQTQTQTQTLPMALVTLQNLIHLSQTQGPSQETPPNFQLLVQLEETYDVSLNQEQRFNPQYYNKAERCLKMCLSTGHNSNSNNNNNNNNNSIVAQEVVKIPQLQTNSLAGLKLLIKGKVTIRRGILQLHGDNTTVLGGSVPELVRQQQQAIEKAKKQAGVGVDPTLRALVNRQEDEEEDEQPQDEAHEESRDVTVTVAPPTTTVTTTTTPVAPIPPRDMPPPQNNYSRISSSRTPPPRVVDNTSIALTTNRTTTNTATQAATMATTAAARPRQQQQPQQQQQQQVNGQNPYARPSLTSTTSTSSGYGDSISPPPPVSRRPANPYAIPGPSTTITTNRPLAATTTTAAATTNTNAPSSTVNRNPYHSSSSTADNNNNTLTRREPLLESHKNHPSSTNTNTNTNFTPMQPSLPINNTFTTTTTTPSTTVSSLTMASPLAPQAMAFGNLYDLLGQLVHNRQLFESYSHVVFQVAMRQLTDNIHFNIEKNMDYKKNKKAAKYVFVINATFGTNNESRLLACKVPSPWIERYFAKSATELRAMTKSNRAECDRLVKEGGDRLKAQLFQSDIQLWKVTLFPTTAEEVFGLRTDTCTTLELDNTKMPILVLQKDDD